MIDTSDAQHRTQVAPWWVPTTVLLVAALVGANWYLRPDAGLGQLRGMLTLPVLWLVLRSWCWWTLRPGQHHSATEVLVTRRYFNSAILLVFVAVGGHLMALHGVSIWMTLTGVQEPDVGRRLLGLTTGVVLVVLGNTLPTILTPLSMLPPGGATRIQTARRLIGRVWVMLGLVTVAAFVMAPLDVALPVRNWAALGCLMTMLGAIVWMNSGSAVHEGHP